MPRPLHNVSRRSILRGVSLGVGGTLLAPMVQRLSAEVAGNARPMRVVFAVEGE